MATTLEAKPLGWAGDNLSATGWTPARHAPEVAAPSGEGGA
jgi:hypothetical protein